MANTTTSVVQVSVIDEAGKSKTFNIDNPKENLTLNEIRQALQPALNGRWWLGNGGAVITSLKSANYSTSEKIPIEGTDAVITITPSSINTDGQNASVTVEGSPLIGAYISDLSDPVDSDHYYTIIRIQDDEQTVELLSTLTNPVATMKLNIVTEAKTVQIPVTFT